MTKVSVNFEEMTGTLIALNMSVNSLKKEKQYLTNQLEFQIQENKLYKQRLENIEKLAKSFCVIECGFEWKTDCKIDSCEWQQIINECRGKNDRKQN